VRDGAGTLQMAAGRRKETPGRRRFLKLLAGGMVASGLAAAGGYRYVTRIETEWLAVERVAIPLPLEPSQPALEGFKIVLMSDFHLYPFTQIDLVRKAVALANGLRPDLVALTGDYVLERAEAIFDLIPVLAQIEAKYGLFAVLGNHDYWTNAGIVRLGLEEAGIHILSNTGVALGVGKGRLHVAGLDDGWSGQPDLQSALSDLPGDVPAILLMHEPDFADDLSQDGRVFLQLSGHSHGGQVRLPGIGALLLPRYGQRYDQGLYRVRDMWVYTTRGIGVVGPPVRFRCRPEVTEITLVGGG